MFDVDRADLVDFSKHRGLRISCAFWRGFRMAPFLMFGFWVLNKIRIIDLSSALVGVLMSSSKVFFSEQSSFRLRCETFIGIVLCYGHQPCCLLYYLCEITSNKRIHIYRSWMWFRIWRKILADRRIYCYCLLLLFIRKVNKIQNMMYHCSQLAKAIRGEQWLDALN